MGNGLLLARLFTFTSLGIAWLFARMLKYYLFGIHAFGLHWNGQPDFWQRGEIVFGVVIGKEWVLFMIAAAIVDKLVWPVIFREAVNECIEIER